MVIFDTRRIKKNNNRKNFSLEYISLSDSTGLGSCGLFGISGISYLVDEGYDYEDNFYIYFNENNDITKDVLTEIVIFSKFLSKHHCLCLDNEDNFEAYANFIRQFLVQENKYFVNPSSGNKTKLFIIDTKKVEKYLIKKYNNGNKI